jgi:adenosylcobinamide-phosphate synthase|uniref:Cobalamin biosynthesis protein CobD n=1 Tax=Desulfobacca acetoxidans TaxID=60893 RepID=A0A7C3Z486_9BACT
MTMKLALPFLVGYLLDLCLGDPPGWPHPIRGLGRLIAFWERRLYQDRLVSGLLFWLTVSGISLMGVLLVLALAAGIGFPAPEVVVAYLVYTGLATRSLHWESRKVETALARGDLLGARKSLALIVGRETRHLEAPEIRRATLETVAENLSDGVVAPMVYLLLAGVPGLALYKAVNTMDSMVGYRTDRYKRFGKVAARADDVLNFLPARLTAGLICLVSIPAGLNPRQAWRVLRRDGNKTLSPNAGRPEAALAGALGVLLGGPGIYFGRRVEKPFIGDPGPPLNARHYRQAVVLLYGVSGLMACFTFLALLATGAGLGGLLGLLW